tara:strand:- start:661 stop:1491 length:831 start_codon:yes stop_codon:yes gene_type:complete
MANKDTVHIDNRVAVLNKKSVLNLENFSEFYTKEAIDELVGSIAGVTSVNTMTGAVVLTKADVGLSNILNVDLTPAVDLNTAKVGITSGQASEIVANNSKISYTDASAVALNTAKIGITPTQASDIVTNNSKISYTDASAVSLNTAKITFPEAPVDHRSYVRSGAGWQKLNEPFTALTDGANISWDANDDSGKINATVILGGNRILDNPTNMYSGTSYNLLVAQDGTGSRTLTFGTVFKWAGGTAPTLSTAANAVDVFTFIYDGSSLYGSVLQNFS